MGERRRPRTLYYLRVYPQLSETYIRTELDYVSRSHQVKVLTENVPSAHYHDAHPHILVESDRKALAQASAFRPDVIHAHWLETHLYTVHALSQALDIPFTVRAHSFDVLKRNYGPALNRVRTFLGKKPKSIFRFTDILNSDYCRGVLCFPFAIPRLLKAGIKPDKLVPCYPVIDYQRFYSEAPNGDGVINVGACLAKKNFQSYIDLAAGTSEVEFSLYPIGYETPQIVAYNESRGSPCRIYPDTPYAEMPAAYKKHRWLVYTADKKIATVGWSLSVAEAQAAGLGVCFPNLRQDLKEYIGGGGYLYSSLAELRDIISRPPPPGMREQGFEQARKSDIREHLHLLTDLWPHRTARQPLTVTTTG